MKIITNKIQEPFIPLIENCINACNDKFGTAVISSYVAGSVGSGEAWPYNSDLDWWTFLSDYTEDVSEWRKQIEHTLTKKYPVVKNVHMNIYPIQSLEKESFWRFILKYNSLLIYGTDIVAQLEHRCFSTPKPCPDLAFSRIKWIKQCTHGLNSGFLPKSLFDDSIPANISDINVNDYQATRKLARNFVLLEGAYLLMAKKSFKSFRLYDVLPNLKLLFPEWLNLLNVSESAMTNPEQCKIKPHDFIEQLKPFSNWLLMKIENKEI